MTRRGRPALPGFAQYDLAATTYSPDGKVFQTEYAQKAVDNSRWAGGVATTRRGRDPGSGLVLFGRHTLTPLSRPPLPFDCARSTTIGLKCKDGVVLVSGRSPGHGKGRGRMHGAVLACLQQRPELHV